MPGPVAEKLVKGPCLGGSRYALFCTLGNSGSRTSEVVLTATRKVVSVPRKKPSVAVGTYVNSLAPRALCPGPVYDVRCNSPRRILCCSRRRTVI